MNRAATIGIIAWGLLTPCIAATHCEVSCPDWPGHGGDADETAYTKLDGITARNIGRLGLVWSLDLPGEHSLQATPLAVDGVLYFTGSYSAVYAVDAASGALLWKYDPEIWKHDPARMNLIFGVNRGAAYDDGRIFSGTLDGRLIALQAKTGKLLWSVQTTEDARQTITGAPRAFNGKVIIGNGGADMGARGFVTAYDSVTGRQRWRFHVTPGAPQENAGDPVMERAQATWSGQYWKTGTGGAVWDGITFDRELNRVYLGTGNGGPYDPAQRSPGNGDNLFVASVVALEADTGKYVWHYQVNPRDAWDFDATQQMILAHLDVQGRMHRVLMQAPKNGFFYVIDRDNGELLSAEKTGKVTWADRIDLATGRPVEAGDIRYESGEAVIWPSPVGAHSWQSMSFSPRTGLVYIPTMQLGVRFSKDKSGSGSSFGGLSISTLKVDAEDGHGALLAWDPKRGKPRWKVPLDTLWNGGTLATAGGLVFQGTADGYLSAYDGLNGSRVWHFNAGLGINAAPISYLVGGRQYVSVLVGYGGSAALLGVNLGWKYGAQPRRLLTFAVDGKAGLPPTAPPDFAVKALDDGALVLDQADVQAGQPLFNAMCAMCHGLNLVAAGSPGPDLRESAAALRAADIWRVVHEGTGMALGMPRFDALGFDQVRQIHAYIRAAARAASGAGPPASAR